MTIASALVDAELVERFRDDGFVVVPDLLTADEVDRYGAASPPRCSGAAAATTARWPTRAATSSRSSSA